MTQTRWAVAAAMASGAAIVSLFACANSNEVEPDVDAGLPEASSDAAPAPDDLDADSGTVIDADGAPPSRCSHEGYCRVDVPAGQDLYAVWGDGQGAVWTAGGCVGDPALSNPSPRDGCILRWDGAAFEKVFTGPISLDGSFKRLTAIWGSGPTDIWAGGEAGLFHGRGETSASIVWTKVTFPEDLRVSSIWGTGALDVWITATIRASNQPQVMHYTGGDVDADWVVDSVSSLFRDDQTFRLFGSGADDVWVTGRPAGASGSVRIAHMTHALDGGVTWTDVTPPNVSSMSARAAFSVTPGQAWLALYSSSISFPARLTLETTDSGADAGSELTQFEGVGDYGKQQDITNALWGTSSDDLWMAANFGRLRHWDGTEWKLAFISSTSMPYVADLRGVWSPGVSSPGEVWVVGNSADKGGVVLHRSGGAK